MKRIAKTPRVIWWLVGCIGLACMLSGCRLIKPRADTTEPPPIVHPPVVLSNISPGEAMDGHFKSTVWFATDRMLETKRGKPYFDNKVSEVGLTYGKVEVSIPDSHRIGRLEKPKWYQVWDRENPNRYVLVLSIEPFENKAGFVVDIKQDALAFGCDEALIFIHGFNVGFESAAARTAQLAYDLKFGGIPLLYSWPSNVSLDKYKDDGLRVKASVTHLKDFLRTVRADLGMKKVHVIAHSMGNRALVNALAEFDDTDLPADAAPLGQVIFAAPDVGVDAFKSLSEQFHGKASQFTLYASGNDKAIQISKRINTMPRAGGESVVVKGVHTIDARHVETDFLAHSYYQSSILSDIFMLIHLETPPDSRFGLFGQSKEEGKYWSMLPGAF